jgi:hypothetical protein
MTDLNTIIDDANITWAEIEAHEKRARVLRAEAIAYGFGVTKSFVIKSVKRIWQNWIMASHDSAGAAANDRPNLRLTAPKRPEIFGATNA